jgi:hypothetical protein
MTRSSIIMLEDTMQKAQGVNPGLFNNFFNQAAQPLIEETLTSLYLSSFCAALKSFFGAFYAAFVCL